MPSIIERVSEKSMRGKIKPKDVLSVTRKQTAKAEARKKRSKSTPETINPRNLAGAHKLVRDSKMLDRALRRGLR